MNIVLVGFMGSGKSTLGKALAEKLHYTFIETDVLIEESEKMTIPELFNKKGEGYFRNKETELLGHLQLLDNCVIATGGGMPCFNSNMDLVNQIGHSVWLDVNEKELEKRLWNERSVRPKLLEYNSLQEAISVLLNERKPYYNRARVRLADPTIKDLLNAVKC